MVGTISGKRVFLTGAASGLGAEFARVARLRGAVVYGVDIRPHAGTHLLDITSQSDVEKSVSAAYDEMGGIDIVVNNAGVGWAQDSKLTPDGDSRRMIEVNMFGSWNVATAALPFLSPTGQIVNVSSGIAAIAVPHALAYSIAKRGVVALSDGLRLEVPRGVAVSTFYPGYLQTRIHERNEASGYSVSNIFRHEDISVAGRRLVRTCESRRRSAYSSPLTALDIRLGRLFPAVAERLVLQRFAKHDISPRAVDGRLK